MSNGVNDGETRDHSKHGKSEPAKQRRAAFDSLILPASQARSAGAMDTPVRPVAGTRGLHGKIAYSCTSDERMPRDYQGVSDVARVGRNSVAYCAACF